MSRSSFRVMKSNLKPLGRGRSIRRRSAPMNRSSSPLNLPLRRFSRKRLGLDMVVRKREMILCCVVTRQSFTMERHSYRGF